MESPEPAATRRHRMVEALRHEGVRDPRVLAAMDLVPRERFVAADLADLAYEDRPLPIHADATVSAPSIVARMTEALELTGTERVLEVGTGSGYAAAVLAACAAEVVTLEYDEDLARSARDALDATGFGAVEVRHADGALGAPDRAPFDAVAVTAMAPELPPALLEQLAPGGVLVAPVGPDRDGMLLRCRAGLTEELGPVRFVALRGAQTR
ncbi:protein-L-isoaspartate(D-aspartate) O-methyltransferase [Actinomycetospora endophytica]|uniref:Protein-L-isoaspartate O-methyltransferase n=1 Tax=Actinomycetospora endophytica TaxID=2291215 RepID=A0ABS8P8H8_9PSEU|nr:protein-L-isoaspartate(D-aspartate) O-methyltransferase [Actinomycetospora endophytica]MCD2194541.1 protein-L-isoaspartate(D-aspartate) O-methyltransferase [Actinomycetospora endophytica]